MKVAIFIFDGFQALDVAGPLDVYAEANTILRSPSYALTALAEEPAYVDQSCYWMQIEQYLRWFPSERVLVVLTEDLRDHRSRTLRRILDFLEVDSDWEARVPQGALILT